MLSHNTILDDAPVDSTPKEYITRYRELTVFLVHLIHCTLCDDAPFQPSSPIRGNLLGMGNGRRIGRPDRIFRRQPCS
jgi:hypothetical protein